MPTPPKSPDGAQWNQRYAEHPWPTDPDERMVELVAPLAPGRAIDLGCGTGRNALWLARQGWHVTGVDGSSVGLEMALTSAAAAGVDLMTVEAELTNYVPTPGSFDLVVVANIHLRSDVRDAFYERAREALAPGGHLYVSGHHIESLGRTGPPDPDRLFTEEIVRSFAGDLKVDYLERDEWLNAGDPVALVDVILWAGRVNDEVSV